MALIAGGANPNVADEQSDTRSTSARRPSSRRRQERRRKATGVHERAVTFAGAMAVDKTPTSLLDLATHDLTGLWLPSMGHAPHIPQRNAALPRLNTRGAHLH